MVSLFSLFSGKKKRKSTSRPPSPSGGQAGAAGGGGSGEQARRPARPSSPTRQRSSTRFLSLRGKPSAKPYDLNRRVSTDKRRRSLPATRNSADEAPKLTLGWEGRASGGDAKDAGGDLGLDGVGRPPKLTREECEVVKAQRWGCEEIMQGWKWVGKALRSSNFEASTIMLPLRPDGSEETQQLILSMFTLSIRPRLAPSLPSLIDHYPSSSTTPIVSDDQPWNERLDQVLREIATPVDMAEVLRFLLRRLSSQSVLPKSLEPSSPMKPFLEDDTYRAFVQAEREASYPLEAYETLFLSRLRLGIGAYLEEIFELWAAIVARGESGRASGGRMPLLFGWWVWGLGAKGDVAAWKALYEAWRDSGRKVEHLFYAWIRHQSAKQKLPIRLLQTVERYPFGEPTESDKYLPQPPPSTFPRKTLHVALSTSRPVTKSVRPRALLRQAFDATVDTEPSCPIFDSLRFSRPGPDSEDTNVVQVPLEDVLADASRSFLDRLEADSDTERPISFDANAVKPRQSRADQPPKVDDNLPMYRPFSVISTTSPSSRTLRRRSQSLSDGKLNISAVDTVSPLQALSEELEQLKGGSPSPLKKRPSESVLRPSSNGNLWASFEQAGFGNSPEPDLQLSPQGTPSALPAVDGESSTSGGFEKIEHPITQDKPLPAVEPKKKIEGERVIEIDDLFMPFTEDAQLDPTTINWPPFALVRLREPIASEGEGPIDWLLITLEYHAPPEEPEVTSKRSTSPGAMSTSSRFGSSLGLFRRTSSSMSIRNSNRRSIFSSTHRPDPKRTKSATNLAPLPESQSGAVNSDSALVAPPMSAAMSTAPTEYTITDFGEMVKVSEQHEADDQRYDPSSETKSSDWAYRTEGGAHFIFDYRSTSPTYVQRVLRIGKTAGIATDEHSPINMAWETELLPRLIPPDLLVRKSDAKLEEKWLKQLYKSELGHRPKSRVTDDESSVPYVGSADSPVEAFVMDDLAGSRHKKGESILCVEIKPKWGFLPDDKHVTPTEAAKIKSEIPRYRLHEHFRDPAHTHNDQYNPLDLFSGERLRIRKALEGLWAVWEGSHGKINNWRLYVDGKAVVPAKASSIPALGKASSKDSTIDLVLPSLISSEVLTVLGHLQARLNATDISDLAARFKAAHPETDLFDPSLCTEPSESELRAVIDSYLADSSVGTTEKWSLRERMIAFALSATFKDCSIFIRMPLFRSSGAWQLGGNPTVKIVDLDRKPLSSLKKWYDLDEKLWKHWYANPPVSTAETSSTTVGLPENLVHPKASSSALEGASTRAVYAPTPDRSSPSTPMEPEIETLKEDPLATAAPLPAHAPVEGNTGEIASSHPTTERDTSVVKDDPSATVAPTAPVGFNEERRGSEAVSLADALAITPSTANFPVEHHESAADQGVVGPLEELPTETAVPRPDGQPEEVKAVSPEPEKEDHLAMPVTEVPEASKAEPLVEKRVARSAAPSPSPHPDADVELPEEPATSEDATQHDSPVVPLEGNAVEPTPVAITELISEPAVTPAPEETTPAPDLEDPSSAGSEARALNDQADEPNAEKSAEKPDEHAKESGILSAAGTAAAASAAAVVGAIGAVAGATAVAIDAATSAEAEEDQDTAAKESTGHDEEVEDQASPSTHVEDHEAEPETVEAAGPAEPAEAVPTEDTAPVEAMDKSVGPEVEEQEPPVIVDAAPPLKITEPEPEQPDAGPNAASEIREPEDTTEQEIMPPHRAVEEASRGVPPETIEDSQETVQPNVPGSMEELIEDGPSQAGPVETPDLFMTPAEELPAPTMDNISALAPVPIPSAVLASSISDTPVVPHHGEIVEATSAREPEAAREEEQPDEPEPRIPVSGDAAPPADSPVAEEPAAEEQDKDVEPDVIGALPVESTTHEVQPTDTHDSHEAVWYDVSNAVEGPTNPNPDMEKVEPQEGRSEDDTERGQGTIPSEEEKLDAAQEFETAVEPVMLPEQPMDPSEHLQYEAVQAPHATQASQADLAEPALSVEDSETVPALSVPVEAISTSAFPETPISEQPLDTETEQVALLATPEEIPPTVEERVEEPQPESIQAPQHFSGAEPVHETPKASVVPVADEVQPDFAVGSGDVQSQPDLLGQPEEVADPISNSARSIDDGEVPQQEEAQPVEPVDVEKPTEAVEGTTAEEPAAVEPTADAVPVLLEDPAEPAETVELEQPEHDESAVVEREDVPEERAVEEANADVPVVAGDDSAVPAEEAQPSEDPIEEHQPVPETVVEDQSDQPTDSASTLVPPAADDVATPVEQIHNESEAVQPPEAIASTESAHGDGSDPEPAGEVLPVAETPTPVEQEVMPTETTETSETAGFPAPMDSEPVDSSRHVEDPEAPHIPFEPLVHENNETQTEEASPAVPVEEPTAPEPISEPVADVGVPSPLELEQEQSSVTEGAKAGNVGHPTADEVSGPVEEEVQAVNLAPEAPEVVQEAPKATEAGSHEEPLLESANDEPVDTTVKEIEEEPEVGDSTVTSPSEQHPNTTVVEAPPLADETFETSSLAPASELGSPVEHANPVEGEQGRPVEDNPIAAEGPVDLSALEEADAPGDRTFGEDSQPVDLPEPVEEEQAATEQPSSPDVAVVPGSASSESEPVDRPSAPSSPTPVEDVQGEASPPPGLVGDVEDEPHAELTTSDAIEPESHHPDLGSSPLTASIPSTASDPFLHSQTAQLENLYQTSEPRQAVMTSSQEEPVLPSPHGSAGKDDSGEETVPTIAANISDPQEEESVPGHSTSLAPTPEGHHESTGQESVPVLGAPLEASIELAKAHVPSEATDELGSMTQALAEQGGSAHIPEAVHERQHDESSNTP